MGWDVMDRLASSSRKSGFLLNEEGELIANILVPQTRSALSPVSSPFVAVS
jgi:hypothetical protein